MMKSERVVNRLNQWLWQVPWFERRYADRPRSNQGFDSAIYASLCVDVATMTDLPTELPQLLAPFQHMIRHSFSESLNVRCCLALSDAAGQTTLRLFATQNGDENIHRLVIPRLVGKTETCEQGDCVEINTNRHSFHAQALSGVSTPSWMVLIFDGSAPPAHRIRSITHELHQALSQGLVAVEKQRVRIEQAIARERAEQGAELHDSMAQQLGYLRMKTARLANTCKTKGYTDLEKTTADLALQTHCAYRQARELIANARLSMPQGSLSGAISESIEALEQQSGIVFELDNRLEGTPCGHREATQVLYIVREALHNVVRHSHATHARVVLMPLEQGGFVARIEDNGKGFDAEALRQDSFGLRIMRERAEKMAGSLTIEERSQGGVRIELTVVCSGHD